MSQAKTVLMRGQAIRAALRSGKLYDSDQRELKAIPWKLAWLKARRTTLSVTGLGIAGIMVDGLFTGDLFAFIAGAFCVAPIFRKFSDQAYEREDLKGRMEKLLRKADAPDYLF